MAAEAPALRISFNPRGGKRGARRILGALVLSLLLHVAFLASPPLHPRYVTPGPRNGGPMVVDLQSPSTPAEPVPQPQPQPSIPALPAQPRARPTPRVATPRPQPVPVEPAAEPPQIATPEPSTHVAPQVDMLAMINARRERRLAQDAAAARGEPSSSTPPSQDHGLAALNRNLQTLSGDEGVGGIFEILHKGTLSAEFAFNGWRPDTRRQWREVIDVQVPPGTDIDRAIVRRMIELIRTHYTGDFLWESRRLGRVVTLSARQEDSEGLEDFLIREFFGTPLINRGNR